MPLLILESEGRGMRMFVYIAFWGEVGLFVLIVWKNFLSPFCSVISFYIYEDSVSFKITDKKKSAKCDYRCST